MASKTEKEYYEAELKRTQAKYQYLMAQLNLMQLAGMFDSQSIHIKWITEGKQAMLKTWMCQPFSESLKLG